MKEGVTKGVGGGLEIGPRKFYFQLTRSVNRALTVPADYQSTSHTLYYPNLCTVKQTAV